MKVFETNISMQCPKCKKFQFEGVGFDIEKVFKITNTSKVKCCNCNLVISKKELINKNMKYIEKEIMKQSKKIMGKILK